MEKDIIDIVKEKRFIELTADERLALKELCDSEDEFNQMKSVFLEVERVQFEQISPKKETKEDLDRLFVQTYPKAAPIWYNTVFATLIPKEKPFYKQPLLQIAAVIVLFVMIYPFFTSDLKVNELQPLAKVELQSEEVAPQSNRQEVERTEIVEDAVVPTEENQQIGNTDEEVVFNDGGIDANAQSAPLVAAEFVPEPMDAVLSSQHPDGVFKGEEITVFSQSAAQEPEMFDLLTATF